MFLHKKQISDLFDFTETLGYNGIYNEKENLIKNRLVKGGDSVKSPEEKKEFRKSFCTLAVTVLMGCGSLISVAAAIAAAAAAEAEPQTINIYDTTKETVPLSQKVQLDVNGSKRTLFTTGKTVAELLSAFGIFAGDSQIVVPGLSAAVTPYMTVTVRDAKWIKLTADGKTQTIRLALGRLDESLRLAGITLGSEDVLSEPRDCEVADISNLTIRHVGRKQN